MIPRGQRCRMSERIKLMDEQTRPDPEFSPQRRGPFAGEPEMLGLYISIPFCRSKCTYCNFSSGVYPAGDHARYVERAIEDLTTARDWSKTRSVELPRQVNTICLGGG